MHLWPVEHFFHHKRVPVVPFCDEKRVQLVRGASFRSDFLQNPYFKFTFQNWMLNSKNKSRTIIYSAPFASSLFRRHNFE